jgi:hypothetical protein
MNMTETAGSRKPQRKGIQSIEVGFSILSVLMAASKPLPLKTISERSGLSPSKVHSYLVSFCALDLVVQHRDMGTYGLGSYALKMGLAFLEQFDLFSVARPEMSKLADTLGATVLLGVWGNRRSFTGLKGPMAMPPFWISGWARCCRSCAPPSGAISPPICPRMWPGP